MRPNWFVAVPVPAEDWLSDVLADMPRECRGFVPGDVHMTVAFLGAMDPQRADAVIETMKSLNSGPMTIKLGSLLALPAPKRVSALSFGVSEGKDRAKSLIGQCRSPLIETAGARPDHRPPLAHITIARPLRKAGAEGRRIALDWAQRVQPPDLTINLTELALYTWAEDRRVRQFQVVYRQDL